MALLIAINAVSIDIMLPGLQQIGESLNVTNENQRQWVITAYLLGMGIAQLFFGPLSDRFGRKYPLIAGMVIYILSALVIMISPDFTLLLLFRFIQGIGAAASRVITLSIIRDAYGGRKMAEILSLVMMVFMIVPVIAPGVGQLLLVLGEWRIIFAAIAVYALGVTFLVMRYLPETLPIIKRRTLKFSDISAAFIIVLTHRASVCYALAVSFLLGALYGFINSSQQILTGIYQLGNGFPLVFAAFALVMAASSWLNAKMVRRYGMTRLSHGAMMGFILVSLIWVIATLLGDLPFAAFVLFYTLTMLQFGLITANFNALAMVSLGHISGTASSVLGFLQTIIGGLAGGAIGMAFNGTVMPLAVGFLVSSILALIFVLIGEKGQLFVHQQSDD
ncbi:multidrug effflux MFS transporter [Pantoea sp. B65]